MSYTILNNDKSILLRLADSAINNTTTSLTFVGRDYQGYGQYVNQNLVTLLTNSANDVPPENPITGELWYDTIDNKLRVYDDTTQQFRVVGAATTASSTPTTLAPGDFWFDTTNQQLKIWNGAHYVGLASYPLYYNNVAVGGSGWVVPASTIRDSTFGGGQAKDVVVLDSFGFGMGALSTEAFTVSTPDSTSYFSRAGQSNFNLVAGLTIIGDILSTNNLRTSGELIIANQNDHGGNDYAGLMTLSNTNPNATNANKYIRMNITGELEIINSTYTKDIFSLNDSGKLTVPSLVVEPLTPANSAAPGSTGQIAWDDDYIYVYTSAGWKRIPVALTTF